MKYVGLFFCALLVSCVSVKTEWVSPETRTIGKLMPSIIASIDSTLLTHPADSLTKNIEIELTDRQVKEGIPFANAVLYQGNVQKYIGTSNMDGIMQFKNVSPGTYKIKAAYVGYTTLESIITITNNYYYKIKIALGNSGVELSEVIICD